MKLIPARPASSVTVTLPMKNALFFGSYLTLFSLESAQRTHDLRDVLDAVSRLVRTGA